ncbi:glycosyltransferase [Streptomyces sp. NBC_01537]|uniref:glycosyltransferase n=1 Tax=Streptomyces sp. NBC_01537 TaxID=2903896 RepID=UPI00386B46FD
MTTVPPRVRLVVPTTGQRPLYLRQCLDSIRRQREPIEVVIVAPASAASVLHAFAERYECRLLVERDSGISNAVNQGWEETEADYVGWLGDDDLLADCAVSVAVQELERNPAAAMVYGRVQVIDAQGHHVFTMRPGKFAPSILRFGPNFVWQPGSLYRRDAVSQVGLLDPSLRYAMDMDLHLRLREKGVLVYIPRLLAAYRLHPTSLTVTNPEPNAERRMVIRRHLGRVARSWESCWWPLVMSAARAWRYAHFRTGREERLVTTQVFQEE